MPQKLPSFPSLNQGVATIQKGSAVSRPHVLLFLIATFVHPKIACLFDVSPISTGTQLPVAREVTSVDAVVVERLCLQLDDDDTWCAPVQLDDDDAPHHCSSIARGGSRAPAAPESAPPLNLLFLVGDRLDGNKPNSRRKISWCFGHLFSAAPKSAPAMVFVSTLPCHWFLSTVPANLTVRPSQT